VIMFGGIRGKGGQIATLITLILAVLILLSAVLMNIGEFAQKKLRVSQAADSAALSLANNLGSYARFLSHKYLNDGRRKCKRNWGLIVGIVLTIVFIAFQWWVPAILSSLAVAIQLGLIEPAIADAYNRQLNKLQPQDRFREEAILTGLLQAVDDPVMVPDEYDLDEDGETGRYVDVYDEEGNPVYDEQGNPKMKIEGDRIGRFFRWYSLRLGELVRQGKLEKDGSLKILDDFRKELLEFWKAERKFMRFAFTYAMTEEALENFQNGPGHGKKNGKWRTHLRYKFGEGYLKMGIANYLGEDHNTFYDFYYDMYMKDRLTRGGEGFTLHHFQYLYNQLRTAFRASSPPDCPDCIKYGKYPLKWEFIDPAEDTDNDGVVREDDRQRKYLKYLLAKLFVLYNFDINGGLIQDIDDNSYVAGHGDYWADRLDNVRELSLGLNDTSLFGDFGDELPSTSSSAIVPISPVEKFNDIELKLYELLRILSQGYEGTIGYGDLQHHISLLDVRCPATGDVDDDQSAKLVSIIKDSDSPYTVNYSSDGSFKKGATEWITTHLQTNSPIYIDSYSLILPEEKTPFYVPGTAFRSVDVRDEVEVSGEKPKVGIGRSYFVINSYIDENGELVFEEKEFIFNEEESTETLYIYEYKFEDENGIEQTETLRFEFVSDDGRKITVREVEDGELITLRYDYADEDESKIRIIDYDVEYEKDGDRYPVNDQLDFLKWGLENFNNTLEEYVGQWMIQYRYKRRKDDYRRWFHQVAFRPMGYLEESEESNLEKRKAWVREYKYMSLGMLKNDLYKQLGEKSGYSEEKLQTIDFDNWYDEMWWIPDDWCIGSGERARTPTPVKEKGWYEVLKDIRDRLNDIKGELKDEADLLEDAIINDLIDNELIPEGLRNAPIAEWEEWDKIPLYRHAQYLTLAIKQALIRAIDHYTRGNLDNIERDENGRIMPNPNDGRITAFMRAIMRFREVIEGFAEKLENLKTERRVAFNPIYAWEDSRGVHIVRVAVSSFRLPYIKAYRRGLKRCMKLKNGTGKIFAEVIRFDEPRKTYFWTFGYPKRQSTWDFNKNGKIDEGDFDLTIFEGEHKGQLDEIKALMFLGSGIRERSYATYYWQENRLPRLVDKDYAISRPRYSCD